MNIRNFFVVGVMSGTSLDGVDLAYIRFTESNKEFNYEIMFAETFVYDDFWIKSLKEAINFDEDQLSLLNIEYTKYLSSQITFFISKHNIEYIDIISSHGHTIKHNPTEGFTLQIGNLPLLKEMLPYPIICDFRVQDVALGGQGAPLVPIGDRFLFSEYDYCINLGGFSNVSYENNTSRIAFDLSPVNTVLNHYANKFNLAFDTGGNLARSGNFNINLFNKLNSNPYFFKSPPKSLGIEFVYSDVLPLLDSYSINSLDIMHTYVKHVAFQIIEGLPTKNGSILFTGGGVYNTFLMEEISNYGKEFKIIIPNSLTIEFKEALIFGFLGLLRYLNLNNVLASVTGASKDHSSGIIY